MKNILSLKRMTLLKYVKDGNMSLFKLNIFRWLLFLFFTITIFDSYSMLKKEDNRSMQVEI